jgi:ATP/maltotriose-dependent transcriptional regulator MalT
MAAVAKTSGPRPTGAVRRERLFRLLDQRDTHPVTWVCGPAGAGKTTLVATYLEANKAPTLWYRIDPSDADPATIFYYLSRAVGGASRRRAPLPLLAPEHTLDLASFSRRFFRAFYERLAPGSVVVLDDYEKIPADLPFHAVISHALAEIPHGMSVIAVSREEPPAALTRLLVSRTMQTIPAEALRLTLEETRSIATHETPVDEGAIHAMHAAADGWATGLALMLKNSALNGAKRFRIDGYEALLDYFQTELFKDFDAETQKTQDTAIHTELSFKSFSPKEATLTCAVRGQR